MGELHQSGQNLTTKYLSDDGQETFYKDEEGTSWLKSGDQAIMHPNGRIYVSGRFKDFINRGGEMLSRTSIAEDIFEYSGVEARKNLNDHFWSWYCTDCKYPG